MRSASTISARLSRSSSSVKRHQPQLRTASNSGNTQVGSSGIAIAFAILATVLAFGGTIFLAILMMTSSPQEGQDFFSHTSLGLRQSAALHNQKMTLLQHSESEKLSSSQGVRHDDNTNAHDMRMQLQSDKKEETLLKSSRSTANNDNDHDNDYDNLDISNHRGIIIKTPYGNIKIHFTPEYSGIASIRYLLSTVQSSSCVKQKGCLCERCKFYRAEPNLLLQGVIADTVPRNKELGPCPLSSTEREEYESKRRTCPEHDPNCGCHGPVMTKGMVGWAGGGGGPDFFVNTHEAPVQWWEMQHTVWGEVRDEESFGVVEKIYNLPAHLTSMRMLDEEIEFYLELF
ncbi:hypothetical protein ACHAXS_008205 [Conticribra weissflogii]